MSGSDRFVAIRVALTAVALQALILAAAGVVVGLLCPPGDRLAIVFVYALGALLSLLASWIACTAAVYRGLTRRLAITAETLGELERGELDRRLEVEGRDELAAIQHGINRMAEAMLDQRRAADEGTARLERSQASLAAVLDAVAEGVVVTDAEGRVQQVNRTACTMLQREPDELAGERFEHHLTVVDPASGRELALPDPSPESGSQGPAQVVLKRPEGGDLPIKVKAGKLTRGSERVGLVYVLTDLGRVVAAQLQAMQADKLAAVGQLSGGVAHDFNNLLTVIVGQIEMAKVDEDLTDEQRDRLDLVLRAAERASELTASLLAFSRQGALPKQWFDLDATIANSVDLLREMVDPSIHITTELDDCRHRIKGQRIQIQNVLVNLCLNARDAMPEGGTIRIASRLVRLNGGHYRRQPHHLEPGAFLELSVSDDGHGIPPEAREHLFEPFFSTKEPGKGVGLALSSAYGTVKEHGGLITFESEPGEGTTFYILLPLYDESTGARVQGSDLPADPDSEQTGSILVVDDDDSVRLVLRSMLERLGYQVLTATTGQEAVECFRERHAEIALVMVDLMMPDKDGFETLAELLAIDPDLQAVTCSGFAEFDRETDPAVKNCVVLHLTKPYRLGKMEQTMREALAKAALRRAERDDRRTD